MDWFRKSSYKKLRKKEKWTKMKEYNQYELRFLSVLVDRETFTNILWHQELLKKEKVHRMWLKRMYYKLKTKKEWLKMKEYKDGYYPYGEWGNIKEPEEEEDDWYR